MDGCIIQFYLRPSVYINKFYFLYNILFSFVNTHTHTNILHLFDISILICSYLYLFHYTFIHIGYQIEYITHVEWILKILYISSLIYSTSFINVLYVYFDRLRIKTGYVIRNGSTTHYNGFILRIYDFIHSFNIRCSIIIITFHLLSCVSLLYLSF